MHDELIDVYCTVITGFEKVAANEVSTKLNNAEDCVAGRGNVRFSIPLNDVSKVTDLRSVDNIFVVFYENVLEGLHDFENEKAMKTLQGEISYMNWKKAIATWQIAQQKEIFGGTELVVEQMRKFMSTGKKNEVLEESPSFRVTCKRAGDKNAHKFSSMDAAAKFGSEVNNVFGWKTRMKDFDIEVLMRIDKDLVIVMLALNNESLFKRNICAYGPTTMRSTMCYSMLSIADPKRGEIVIDAMCGGGSIPIEGAVTWNHTVFLGGDNHNLAVTRCRQNLEHNKSKICSIGSVCDFNQWDALNLPLRDNSVDVIVTDLPFGKKLGSTSDNRIVYPKFLEEWKRVLRRNGRLVIMTHDRRSWDSAVLKNRDCWKVDSTFIVNVGGLLCLCMRLINFKED